ncbi:MAG: hypothetical protein KIT84_26650 [Labilithrix sp.]|nr:hypothetical protein [Labilithrix sp.]MCW5814634.1 hypothetical protein [Labilithrix sp.]
MDEQTFRELLDPRGILRPGALAPPPLSAGYTVFAQPGTAALDVEALKARAARFFGAKLGLTVEKKYGFDMPTADAARIVLAADDGTAAGTRLCYGRPVERSDLDAAERGDPNATGMFLLAQRCPTLWIVSREMDDDRVALTIAAVMASILLGPILSPGGDELFGVKTARLKLEARAAPYR